MPPTRDFHAAIRRALEAVSPHVVVLDETGSTNDDALEQARAGAAHGTVVVAQSQRAGRGRLDRTWHDEPGASLLASWVVRPQLPVERWTLVPLLAGVAAAEAVRARTRVEATLKWPNDLLVGERKLGGILAEADPPRWIVVGLGVNVSQTSFPADLRGTSIAMEGGIRLDRADLLAHVMRRFDEALSDVDAALERYRTLCSTIGRRVRVERSGASFEGTAEGVDDAGALIVSGEQVAAADIVHLRET